MCDIVERQGSLNGIRVKQIRNGEGEEEISGTGMEEIWTIIGKNGIWIIDYYINVKFLKFITVLA